MILGCGQPHGAQGHNVARVAALRAGLPVTTAGLTVNRFCNSGLQAIVQAAHMVMHRRRRGGDRRRRRVDHDDAARQLAQSGGEGTASRALHGDGRNRGSRREALQRVAATRRTSTRWSASSAWRARSRTGSSPARSRRSRCTRAILDKKTGEKIGEEDARVERDECNRADTTLEGLQKLAPVFDTTSGTGSVTAGNSSQLSDGASATLVMSSDRAKALGVQPLLVFRGYAVAGCEPDEMGIGPVFAVPKLLKKHGLKVDDIDVWELNEAFASQVVYCRDRLGIPMDRLNPNGGSIAIGHPFGMTGSRLVGTIANEMQRRKARYGVVTMCVGGGQGAAALFERC